MAARHFTQNPPINPAALERQFWTHELLVRLAKRSVADGWADLEGGGGSEKDRYCMAAADRYLDSAAYLLLPGEPGLDPRGTDPRLKSVAATRQSLKAPGLNSPPTGRSSSPTRRANSLPIR